MDKAKLAISIDNKTKEFGTADPVFTGTPTGLVGSDTVTGYNRSDKGEVAGQYAIDQYQLNDDNGGGNYEVTVYYGTLTINEPAQINIPPGVTWWPPAPIKPP